jgi:hypothetical protein
MLAEFTWRFTACICIEPSTAIKTKSAMSAKELIPTDAKLVRVFHNPDWS